MSLDTGARLGVYEVFALLGAGGMGEVYRARDTRLNRDVAIKILPEAFAADAERVARFQREAQVLASLNHPNIAHIYGLEHAGSHQALVLELVDGPTLADRISQGPIPLDEALSIARQIAEALEAAHEQGIVHRDLKPANIKVRADGTVKVLDFGLAKALVGGESASAASRALSQSPTITSPAPMTGGGVILGTAAYMSPEQARGKAVDKRTDIWSFGCVLYEMLTGTRAFKGESVSDVLAEVLKSSPDWVALPAEVSPAIRQHLRRCLEKDRAKRIPDIGVARIEIDEVLSGSSAEKVPPKRGTRGQRLPWLIAASAAVVLSASLISGFLSSRTAPAGAAPIMFSVESPEQNPNPTVSLAMSPDGSYLAFVGANAAGQSVLWVRPLKALTAQALSGTEGASDPFWSPDSRSLAFFAVGKLKRVSVDGGPVQSICDVQAGRPGSWNREGTILFSDTTAGSVLRVSSSGGTPKAATTLDESSKEYLHVSPHFLPDGKRFLFSTRSTKPERSGVYLKGLDSSEVKIVLSGMTSGVAYATGYLVYVREGFLIAQPFDENRAEIIGEPIPITEGLAQNDVSGRASFSISTTGVLAYRSGGIVPANRLVWRDRTGKDLGSIGQPGPYRNPRLSPDGTRIALEVSAGMSAQTQDIWLKDVSRATATRFTFETTNEVGPVWSPDGTRLVYSSGAPGPSELLILPASGSGQALSLLKSTIANAPEDWSPDGKLIVYRSGAMGRSSVWLMPADGSGKPTALSDTRFNAAHPRISPNGRWLAYASTESGRPQIYVTNFPSPTGKWQISTNGGVQPVWRRDGRELFYIAPDNKLMAVPLNSSLNVEAGPEVGLFEVRVEGGGLIAGGINHQYDISPDGQRFLVNTMDATRLSPITVVVNWTSGLAAR